MPGHSVSVSEAAYTITVTESLENGYFSDQAPLDWGKVTTYHGIVTLYRDHSHLRRN